MIMNAYLVRKYSYTPAQRRRTTMVLDGQRMGDERDWVLVGFFVTCSSSAEKRFIRPAKQDEMGLWWGQSFARKTTTPDEIFSLIGGRFRGGYESKTQQSTKQTFSCTSQACVSAILGRLGDCGSLGITSYPRPFFAYSNTG